MGDLRSPLPSGLRAGRRIGDRPQVLHSRAGPPGSSFPNNIGVVTILGGGAPIRWSSFRRRLPADGDPRGSSEEAMRNVYPESEAVRIDNQHGGNQPQDVEGLPNRLLTAREVARFVGCHEETVRRAYWRGLLRSQRFGVRRRRFHPRDVLEWIRRGAPTRMT
jgi:excisionase family DNA binding protein